MRESLANTIARDRSGRRFSVGQEVVSVLIQRHGRNAHIMVMLEKQQRATPAFIRDPIAKGRATQMGPPIDLALMCALQKLEHGLNHGKLQSHAASELDPAVVGPKV